MGAVDTGKEETHNTNNETHEVRSCEASYFLNAQIQRIHYNSTVIGKTRKMPLRISHRSGTFHFKKLEFNREKPLYTAVFDCSDKKKKKTDYSIKIVQSYMDKATRIELASTAGSCGSANELCPACLVITLLSENCNR